MAEAEEHGCFYKGSQGRLYVPAFLTSSHSHSLVSAKAPGPTPGDLPLLGSIPHPQLLLPEGCVSALASLCPGTVLHMDACHCFCFPEGAQACVC